MPSYSQLVRQIPRRFMAGPTRKAFIFAYIYVALPKVIAGLVKAIAGKDPTTNLRGILTTLLRALHPLKFPMVIARMIGTSSALTPIFSKAFKSNWKGSLVASFIGAALNFPFFQRHTLARSRHYSLDFTLILVTRALDTISSGWLPVVTQGWVPPILASSADGLLFTISSCLIMHNWFFHPKKLPPAYHRWITLAADVDPEIVAALRAIHDGTLRYGEPSPDQHVMDSFAIRYGRKPEDIDFLSSERIPCEVLHCFRTKSCELNALWRFARGFKFSFRLYGILNLVMFLIRRKHPLRLMMSTLRSLTFLGVFIGFYWYGLCTTRRLLPLLFPNIPATRWDNTVVPFGGAASCGFSCFIENAQRRKELSLFVAPRALGTLVSSEPTKFNLLLEQLAFAASFLVLALYGYREPSRVRGIMGKGLGAIFR